MKTKINILAMTAMTAMTALLTGCGGSGISPNTPLWGPPWQGTWTGQGGGAGSGRATMMFDQAGNVRGQFEGDAFQNGTYTGTEQVFVRFHFSDYADDVTGTLTKNGNQLTGTVSFRDLSWAVSLRK